MTLFTLSGIDSSDKVPMFAADNRYGQGKATGAGAWYVVCTGNKTADGTVTADSFVGQIFDEAEANAKLGPRSECAQQVREALKANAFVVAAPVAEAAGAAQAQLVLQISALGTGTGQVWLHIGDESVSFSVDVASLGDTMAAAVAAINAKSGLFCSATLGAGPDFAATIVVTSAGIRGNDWLAKLDTTYAPSGFAATLGYAADPDSIKTLIATVAAGVSYSGADLNGAYANPGPAVFPSASAVTVITEANAGSYVNASTITITGTVDGVAGQTEVLTITGTDGGQSLKTAKLFTAVSQVDIQAQVNVGGGFTFGTAYADGVQTDAGWSRFTGGSGTDDASNVIELLEAAEYRRIAIAQNDAVNAARWEAYLDGESAPLVAHLEQGIFGHNGTLAAATTLSQTTLNAYLCGLYARRNSRKHPAQIAARVAANRCVAESVNAWTRHDGLWNDPSAQLWTDVPADPSDEWTHAEQKALLNAGVSPIADFAGTTSIVRSITTHSLSGTDPDYRCLDTANVSVAQYVRDEVKALARTEAESNPGVGPDLPDGLPQIEGVSTPRIWNATVEARLEEIQATGWIRDVASNPPITEYNTVTDANETIVPVVVRAHQHQIFASIRQVAA